MSIDVKSRPADERLVEKPVGTEGNDPIMPPKELEMTGIWFLPGMHSRTVGCIIYDKRTGQYYNISCPRCGSNAYGKDQTFFGGISGMRAHWQRSRRCGDRDFSEDDLLAAATTKRLPEHEALTLVSHPELIRKKWDD